MMTNNFARSAAPTNTNDAMFFSILQSSTPEKELEACVTNGSTRQAFKEFESHHPHLVRASPILNRVSILAKELDYKESCEHDSTAFAFQGIHYIASKVYSLTYAHFSKGTERLERIILTEQLMLADYLKNHPLSDADADLINAYIDSGILDLQTEGKCLLETPGVMYKLLSREESSSPWIAHMAGTDPDRLMDILTFEVMVNRSGIKKLFSHFEKIFAIDRNLSIKLLHQMDSSENICLTRPEIKPLTYSWIHLLAKKNPQMMLDVLNVPDDEGKPLFHETDCFNCLLSAGEKLAVEDPQGLLRLLGRKDHEGNTILSSVHQNKHRGEDFAIDTLVPILKLLAKSEPIKTIQLLDIENNEGMTVLTKIRPAGLIEHSGLHACIPVLRILAETEPHEVAKLVSRVNVNNNAAFNISYQFSLYGHKSCGMDLLEPIFEAIYERDPDSVVTLMKNVIKTSPIEVLEENLDTFLPMVIDLVTTDPDIALDILLLKDSIGNLAAISSSKWSGELSTFLYTTTNMNIVNEAKARLTAADKNGNTIFHTHIRPDNEKYYKTLAHSCGIDLAKLVNKYNLTPLDPVSLTKTWLYKPKDSVQQIPAFTEEEYSQKAQALKKYVLEQWNSLNFGYGPNDVSPIDLDFECQFNPDEPMSVAAVAELKAPVTTALETILRRVELKTPFFLTPEANDKEGLHRYYSGILHSFETIVDSMKDQEAGLKAGKLISAARVEAEGRCGTAYSREFRQQARLCAPQSENHSNEDLIREAVHNALEASVEKLVGDYYNGDVHYLTQFLFSVGLEKIPDRIAGITPIQARNFVLTHMNVYKFLSDFASDIDSESIAVYLKSKTPDDFDGGYLAAIKEARRQEGPVLERAKTELGKSFSQEQLNSAMNAMIDARLPNLLPAVESKTFSDSGNLAAAAYETGMATLKSTLGPLLNAFSETPSLPEKLDARSLDAFEAELKDLIKSNLVKRDPNTLRLAFSGITNLRKTLQAAYDFEKQMRSKGFGTDQQIKSIIQVKEALIGQLNQLAGNLENEQPARHAADLSYEARSGGLPSQIFDNTRRLEYNKETIGSEPLALLRALEVMGVLHPIQPMRQR